MAAISFCIPFYSGKDFLIRAVSSIRHQSFEDWELLVVDDCGPDQGIGALLEEFQDSRLRYVRNDTNLGMAGNWNRCLNLAKSPLVSLVHADDELNRDYAQLMIDAFRMHPDAAAIFCRTKIIDEKSAFRFSFPDFVKRFLMPKKDQTYALQGESAVRALLKGNFIFCPSLCYRLEKIQSLRFSGRWKMVLDFEFIMNLLFQGHSLVGLPDKQYFYRRHRNNQTVHLTKSLIRFREEVDIYHEIADKAHARGWIQAEKTARQLSIIRLHLLYQVGLSLVELRWKSAALQVRFMRDSGLLP